MTRQDLHEEVLNLLDELLHALYTTISQLSVLNSAPNDDNTEPPASGFVPTNHWTKFDQAVQSVSKEATIFSMTFISEVPSSSECRPVIEMMSAEVLNLYMCTAAVKNSTDNFVWNECYSAVISVLGQLKLLTIAVKSGPEHVKKVKQSVGTVWEACDAALKIPHDVETVIVFKAGSQLTMVEDAINELNKHMRSELPQQITTSDVCSGDSSCQPVDVNTVRRICRSGQAMIKAVRGTLRKVILCFSPSSAPTATTAAAVADGNASNANCSTVGNADQSAAASDMSSLLPQFPLDNVDPNLFLDPINRMSRVVDNFVVELGVECEHMDMGQVYDEADNLGAVADQLLVQLRALVGGEGKLDEELAFFQKVLQHNTYKLGILCSTGRATALTNAVD
jgi:hypothetical protein